MSFTEEWFPEVSQKALATLVESVASVPGLIVEIGAWQGRSTVTILEATDRPVHSVDTWQGSPGEISAQLADGRDVFKEWQTNTAPYRNVQPHRMGWREYVTTISGPIALVFIDAEHTYVEVRDCIQAFLPLMADGGIICGDDNHHPPVKQAVLDTLGEDETYASATLWIWKKPMTARLARMYRRLCDTPSDINEHLPVLAGLVEKYQASHVIECGTRTGLSTVAFLHALSKTGGRLTSIDIDARPPVGEWPHWTFHQSDDTDPTLVGSLEPAEIVFIDTSHHYQHTLDELRLYRPLVKPGGVIVLHDTELPMPEGWAGEPYPVKRAIEDFVAVSGDSWVNLTNCWGLGIISIEG